MATQQEVKRFQIGAATIYFHHDETLSVLAGAYKGRDISERTLHTHTVFVDSKGHQIRTACRQPVDSMADHYSASDEERGAAPTCPTCLRAWLALDSRRMVSR